MTASKFHNKKTVLEVDGKPRSFDSQKEALRYIELTRLKQVGIVTAIECQPEFELQPAYRKCCGRKHLVHPAPGYTGPNICGICGKKMPAVRARVYRADFRVVYSDGHTEIEDVKGMETEMFRFKRDLFEFQYPSLTLKVVKGVRR
jgi:hypothetical protein